MRYNRLQNSKLQLLQTSWIVIKSNMTFAVSKHLFSQNFINGTRGPGYYIVYGHTCIYIYKQYGWAKMDHYICEEQTISWILLIKIESFLKNTELFLDNKLQNLRVFSWSNSFLLKIFFESKICHILTGSETRSQFDHCINLETLSWRCKLFQRPTSIHVERR